MLTRDHPTIAVVLGVCCGLIVSAMCAWTLAQGPAAVFGSARSVQPRIVSVGSTSLRDVDDSAFRPVWPPAGEPDVTGPQSVYAQAMAQAASERTARAMASTRPRAHVAAAPIRTKAAPAQVAAAPARAQPAKAKDKGKDKAGNGDWGDWGDWGDHHRGKDGGRGDD